jgi:phosphate acetyltransferase
MAAVVHKDSGIHTARRISHVFVMDLPAYSKLLLIPTVPPGTQR